MIDWLITIWLALGQRPEMFSEPLSQYLPWTEFCCAAYRLVLTHKHINHKHSTVWPWIRSPAINTAHVYWTAHPQLGRTRKCHRSDFISFFYPLVLVHEKWMQHLLHPFITLANVFIYMTISQMPDCDLQQCFPTIFEPSGKIPQDTTKHNPHKKYI